MIPSNEGRGYVLRKIIRRASASMRMASKRRHTFLSEMSDAVRAEMKNAYPELMEAAARVNRILDEEETRFTRTVEVGVNKEISDGKLSAGTSDRRIERTSDKATATTLQPE